jgi:hypothetical protein
MNPVQPVSDLNIYRSAARWVEKHGDQAVVKARERLADVRDTGDTIGTDAWLRIIEAIEAAQSAKGQPRDSG